MLALRQTMNRHAIATMSILLASHALAVSLPQRSVSSSRQFILYGADARLRGAVSELAETTKGNLLELLRQSFEAADFEGWWPPTAPRT